jgi:hypothetical protein
MILADFWSENAVGIIFGIITVVISIGAAITRVVMMLSELKAEVGHIRYTVDQMGKDSVKRGDSVVERVERVEQQVHGLELTLAGMHGAKPAT